MKILNHLLIFCFSLLFTLSGCGDSSGEPDEVGFQDTEGSASSSVIDFPLSAAERDALTPENVVEELRMGNARFIVDSLSPRDRKTRIKQTAASPFPKAMIVSCIDARIPVEEIFDQGLGDIYVGRIGGNFVDEEMLGSIEYATKVGGSKLVVIMGHENCGIIKSAIADIRTGNMGALLMHIQPAIEWTKGFSKEEQTIINPEYVNDVARNNILYALEKIKEESQILAELEGTGEINIVGAFYDVATGEVEFFE